MRRMWVIWSILLALVVGCGGGAYAPPVTSQTAGRYGGTATTAPVSGYEGAGGYAPPGGTATGASADGRRAEAPSVPPTERPGLGTEWGEARSSHVRETSFVRGDPDHPFAVLAMHYNDQHGVEALASYHGVGGRGRETRTHGGAVTVQLRDGSGEPLEALFVGDRTYVVGRAGDRYSIVLQNHTSHRLEIVATVDGLDVVNGRDGNLQNRGYILMPYASLEIDGFRQSNESVAAFRFGRVGDSYAAQTGSARNVGVIGLAFFSERGDPYTEEELQTRDTANPFPGSDTRFARPPR